MGKLSHLIEYNKDVISAEENRLEADFSPICAMSLIQQGRSMPQIAFSNGTTDFKRFGERILPSR